MPDAAIGMSPHIQAADAGFAASWCILNRNYGLRAMAARGYSLVLMRDATMGIEFPDALDTLTATEMAVRESEQQLGFTASNRDFFRACEGTTGS